jgi:VanZ family protein
MLRWFEKNSKVSWAITFLIAAGMFYVSSWKGVPSGIPTFSLNAYLYHLVAYFFLGAFLMVSVVKGKYKHLAIPAAFSAIIYGITDEIHQLFVPGRSCTIRDVGLDSLGIGYALVIYLIVLEVRKNKKVIQQK